MTSGAPDIDRLLGEYLDLRGEPGSDQLALLEAALYLEETFAIALTDADISPGVMGTRELMARLVSTRRGGA